MYTLRCTKKLLARMDASPAVETPAPTTRLGDFYANTTQLGKERIVVCTSTTTFLTIVLPIKGFKHGWADQVRAGIDEMLAALKIPTELREQETAAMSKAGLGPTNDKRMLGVMNSIVHTVEFYMYRADSLMEIQLRLASGVHLASTTRRGVFPHYEVFNAFGLRKPNIRLWPPPDPNAN